MLQLPLPYEDEVIGSLIIRACIHYGLPMKRMVKLLTGANRSLNSFLISTSLRRISALTGMPAEDLLMKHTMFPYVVAFVSTQLRAQLLCKVLEPNPGVDCIASITNNVTRGVPFRRFCGACLEEDLARYGESYWHRAHLLPAVLACPAHGEKLRTTSVPMRGMAQARDLYLPQFLRGQIENVSTPLDVQMHIASTSIGLLNKPLAESGNVFEAYREQAIRLGYVLNPHEVAATALSRAVEKYFGKRMLKDAGCGYPSELCRAWPQLMVRSTSAPHYSTAKHVLLRVFLETSPAVTADPAWRGNPRGPISGSRKAMDSVAARRARALWKRLARIERRSTVAELLTEAGIWSLYRHNRKEFPRTEEVVLAFRNSDQSERQMGKRLRWRRKGAA